MNYYLAELHAHTRHSDGDFTTLELLTQARAFGYDILAITDHNTMAPVQEVVATETSELLVLSGMEWTTFFGHLLVIGANRVVDWRKATIETIDESLVEIKEAQGIVGIAHPFSIGSPICTGCHWDYHVNDYNLVDFIEVWNRLNPDEDYRSQLAYEMWVDLLNQGYRISCSAGRDWHREEALQNNTALTYIGATEKTSEAILASLREGNYYISLGPEMRVHLQQNDQVYYMGQELLPGPARLEITVQATMQEKLKSFNFVPTTIVLWQNNQIIHCEEISLENVFRLPVVLENGYIRVEIFGLGKGSSEKRLIIGNPFYVSE